MAKTNNVPPNVTTELNRRTFLRRAVTGAGATAALIARGAAE